MEKNVNINDNMEKNKKMRKLMKFLIVFLAVITFVTITLKQFTDEKFGMASTQELIGTEYSGGEALTVRENLILKAAVDAYVQAIHSGDIEKAYAYVYPEYKEIVLIDAFEAKIKEIGAENFVIEDLEIVQETDKLFSFHVTIKNENKLHILMILDEKNYYLVPEPFLEYNVVNDEITKKGVTYTLKGYQVDLERCIFDMTLTNSKDEEVKIEGVKMITSDMGAYKALNGEMTLQPSETKNVSFIVETHIDFPSALEITRNDDEKMRVYTFELD